VRPPKLQPTDHLKVFEQHLRHLRGVVYRLVGSLTEAEDILQDARLRWLHVTEPVEHPRAYLTRVVTRLGLDWLKSARVQREHYVGPWLPEPVLDSGALSLEASTELAQDISMALMLAMERLSPLERAAFLLHDVLDIEYFDVAATLGREETAVRQLAARARSQLRTERARYQPSVDETTRVLSAFASALRTGDTAALHAVLAADVVAYSDGGGRVSAATLPIYGAERVARFLQGLISKWPAYLERVEPCLVNGMPGLHVPDGELRQATAFQIENGRIQAIYTVRNPDKLAQGG
jgi:RNA polymerase sigma-70 factor, ECF subfamily